MEFSEKIKDFYKIFFPVFWPRFVLTGRSVDPDGRPHQGPVDPSGRPTCTDVHVWQTQPRSTGAVDRVWEQSSLFVWVDRAVDRVCPTVNMTVDGRPGGRPPSLSGCHISLTVSFLMGLYKPHFFGILAKIFRAKISWHLQCFKKVFKIV